MSNALIVHKNRKNVIDVELGIDITGNVITSEIRIEPKSSSTLIATWVVSVVDAPSGILTLTLDETVTAAIDVDNGFMDIKRVVAGDPVPLFDRPLDVEFRETVTL